MGLQETGMIGDPLPWPLPQGEGNSFGIASDWNDKGEGNSFGIAREWNDKGEGNSFGIAREWNDKGEGNSFGIARDWNDKGEGNSFGIARDWNDKGEGNSFGIVTAVFGSAGLDASQAFISMPEPLQGDEENDGKEDQHGGDG